MLDKVAQCCFSAVLHMKWTHVPFEEQSCSLLGEFLSINTEESLFKDYRDYRKYCKHLEMKSILHIGLEFQSRQSCSPGITVCIFLMFMNESSLVGSFRNLN